LRKVRKPSKNQKQKKGRTTHGLLALSKEKKSTYHAHQKELLKYYIGVEEKEEHLKDRQATRTL